MDHRRGALATITLALMLGVAALVGVWRQPAGANAQKTAPLQGYQINPNTADLDTLCLLPRIGPGIAQRIIDDREANGPFADADDLQRVPYVGEKTTAEMSPWLRFEPAD